MCIHDAIVDPPPRLPLPPHLPWPPAAPLPAGFTLITVAELRDHLLDANRGGSFVLLPGRSALQGAPLVVPAGSSVTIFGSERGPVTIDGHEQSRLDIIPDIVWFGDDGEHTTMVACSVVFLLLWVVSTPIILCVFIFGGDRILPKVLRGASSRFLVRS